MKTAMLCVLFATCGVPAYAQEKPPVIRTKGSQITIRNGETTVTATWVLAPRGGPANIWSQLLHGKPHLVTVTTDVESVSFTVELGKQYDFIIQKGNDLSYFRIHGMKARAVFDTQYQAAHRGKILIEIPEVYELANIAIALTPTGLGNENLAYQKSDYYSAVRKWFDRFQGHPLLTALDSALKKNAMAYHSLKMDAYAFEFDAKSRIVASNVYDCIGFSSENTLRPHVSLLQSFAEESGFRKFYKAHRKTYDDQIAFYRDVADIPEMKRWLDRNFPASNNYDVYKVIFSPLVAFNQSSQSLASNGFKELQAHVNFPYPNPSSGLQLSQRARNIANGTIVFTEINHGYINPEADKCANRILKATSNRDRWTEKGKASDSYPGIATFNEYMNWGLVSLRVVDYVAPDEQEAILARLDGMMSKNRGFPQFAAFNRFLVSLYRARKQGQTVADLYPQIIEWFERNN